MSAREIIAKKLKDMGVHHVDIGAGLLLSGLTASGYRILGPDDLDPVTVERCANLAEADFRSRLTKDSGYEPDWLKHGRRIAAAIRALSKEEAGK